MQFLTEGTRENFAQLELAAKRSLVVYRDQDLPPGCEPAHSRVGFEHDPHTGEAIMRVDPVRRYSGPDGRVRRLLVDGELRFAGFGQLRQFITIELAAAFHRQADADRVRHPSIEELTDLDAVQAALARPRASAHVDEHELAAGLSREVRGQEVALRVLASAAARHVAKCDPRRPLNAFALGPSGVGKSLSAERLAIELASALPPEHRYGHLRLDMNEYHEAHRISQLLGAPQGYVGYGHGASLVDQLASRPRSVIVFEEIEKGHPQLLQALMSAMDAGRVSRAGQSGEREIDCRHAIFMFTSNLDATEALANLAADGTLEDPAAINEQCRHCLLEAGVPPAIVGRIQTFLLFRELAADAQAEVAVLAVQRVAREYGVEISYVQPAVIIELLEGADHTELGARPREHLVDERLGPLFARAARTAFTPTTFTVVGPPLDLLRDKPPRDESEQ